MKIRMIILALLVLCVMGCKDERPENPSEGFLWYSCAGTPDAKLELYNGSEWVDLDRFSHTEDSELILDDSDPNTLWFDIDPNSLILWDDPNYTGIELTFSPIDWEDQSYTVTQTYGEVRIGAISECAMLKIDIESIDVFKETFAKYECDTKKEIEITLGDVTKEFKAEEFFELLGFRDRPE